MNAIRKYLVFCHFAVPIVFLGIAAAALFCHWRLRWEIVVILAIGASPLILPLLAFYVKGFGKDGIMMNDVFAASFPTPQPQNVVPPIQPEPQPKALKKYSKPAHKMLRTLWTFQSKEPAGQSWGFLVLPVSFDFSQFQMAFSELRFDGLAWSDPRGLVSLTPKGIEFCRKHEDELNIKGDIWNNFVPA
jgi:hypothetical protein